MDEAYHLAAEGTLHLINRYRDTNQNLRTQLARILRRAGLTPRSKLFHNLRASRQTELTQRYPIHVVCAWLGNTAAVAAEHYLQVTEAHYKQATQIPDKRGLTLPQQSAIDLLASGKTDTETADLLGLSRVAVSKWSLYDPVFQAALNQRRAEVWGAGCDRMRALVPKALDALADELDNRDNPHRLKAAVEVLKLAQLPSGAAGIGPTAAEEIVRGIVLTRRGRARGPLRILRKMARVCRPSTSTCAIPCPN